MSEIALPTGTGILLPAWLDVAEVAKAQAEQGVTEEDLRNQQNLVVDVPSGWAFAAPAELTEKPIATTLSGALVPIDDLVVVSFTGNSCTRAVGGYAYVTEGQPTVVLYVGQLADIDCQDVGVESRLVLWVPDAKAHTEVASVGGFAPSIVMMPMLDTLPKLLLLPKDFPYYVGG